MRIPSVFAFILALAASAAAQADQRYIVVLHEGVDADAAAAELGGGAADVVLRGNVNGFAGALGAGKAKAAARDARVKYVEVDVVVQTCQDGHAKGKPAPSAPTPPAGETVPPGITRIGAGSVAEGFDFRVAVIDTGVNLTHPDLHVVDGATFIPRTLNANDDNGHGTHVSGTIGAIGNNNAGVVGVAPGIEIVAVKVLDKRGYSFASSVVDGISWVNANRVALNIKVANMSLGGSASSALDGAVLGSINQGITYAVAAGNENADASTKSPARLKEAVTVAAFVDTNGAPGGGGLSTGYGADDHRASFSNYGTRVDVFAPGVSIYSTWKDGGYNTISGTSMATPHVAGVAALVIRSKGPGVSVTPEQVAAQLVQNADATVIDSASISSDDLKGTPNKVVDATLLD